MLPHPEALGPEEPARRLFQAKLQEAQATWPGIHIEPGAFLAHWARHLAASSELAKDFECLQVMDLYFAFGCAAGDAHALAVLKNRMTPSVASTIRGVHPDPVVVEEVVQLLMERLLISTGGGPPRIAEYAGKGPFEHWLRAVALRLALNHRRGMKRAPEVASSDALIDFAAPSNDPLAELLKSRYRKEVEAALKTALSALSREDRNLVKLHFVDGLSLNQIGAVYQANKSTISRRLARARQELLLKAQTGLRDRLGAGGPELESLIALLGSQIDLSLRSGLLDEM